MFQQPLYGDNGASGPFTIGKSNPCKGDPLWTFCAIATRGELAGLPASFHLPLAL
ncbi:MAG: hypothetical protein ABSE06_07395 [Anaerolineaceae bacterium]